MDPKCRDYDKSTPMKCFLANIIYMLRDDNLQVNGTAVIGDLTGFTVQHQLFWSPDDLKKLATVINVSSRPPPWPPP